MQIHYCRHKSPPGRWLTIHYLSLTKLEEEDWLTREQRQRGSPTAHVSKSDSKQNAAYFTSGGEFTGPDIDDVHA